MGRHSRNPNSRNTLSSIFGFVKKHSASIGYVMVRAVMFVWDHHYNWWHF